MGTSGGVSLTAVVRKDIKYLVKILKNYFQPPARRHWRIYELNQCILSGDFKLAYAIFHCAAYS